MLLLPQPSPYLDAWKDNLLEVALERPNADTGLPEPAAGYTDVELTLSATEFGAAIGSLGGVATERPLAPGVYFVGLDLATITTDLPEATYPHGAVLFRQVRKAGDIAAEAFRVTLRRRKY